MLRPIDGDGREACAGVEPDLMFPDEDLPSDHPDVQEAKKVCAGCPIRDLCLERALSLRTEYGVWGGLTPREREAMRRRVARADQRRRERAVQAAAQLAAPGHAPVEWADQGPLVGVMG